MELLKDFSLLLLTISLVLSIPRFTTAWFAIVASSLLLLIYIIGVILG